ncbi:MAG: hypothetical protein PGN25_01540 [Methylorubrum populi]
MPTHDADAIVAVAALCEAARAKLPVSGFHRLRVLLDMIRIDLARESVPATEGRVPGRPAAPGPRDRI